MSQDQQKKQQQVQEQKLSVKQNGEVSTFFMMFLAGAAGCITVSFIHPIDVLKTWLQVNKSSHLGIFEATKKIYSSAGAKAFYKGLSAAYVRESVNTSSKMGLYETAKLWVGAKGKDSTTFQKFAAGAVSGALGSIFGNPFDVLKTRMMADPEARLSMFTHMKDIQKSSGILGFYKGIDANIMRAAVLNSTKMGVYDTTKTKLKNTFSFKDGIMLQTCCAAVSGFFMACTVTPFDMLRTRLMNKTKDGVVYKNLFHAAQSIVKNEGIKALYKGFFPVWGRFAPTTTLQLIIFEQFRKQFGISSL